MIVGFAATGMDPSRLQSFAVLAPAEKAASATLDLARTTLALLNDEAATIADSDVRIDGTQRGEGDGIAAVAMLAPVRLLA